MAVEALIFSNKAKFKLGPYHAGGEPESLVALPIGQAKLKSFSKGAKGAWFAYYSKAHAWISEGGDKVDTYGDMKKRHTDDTKTDDQDKLPKMQWEIAKFTGSAASVHA
jgi:hypothetical protein